MALASAVTADGVHHIAVTGSITVGAATGEVPAIGLNQLMRIPLPYIPKVYSDRTAFEAQLYSVSKALDANLSDIRLDAQAVEYDVTTGQPIMRYRVDIVAAPAAVQILIEAHHSVGR